MAAVPPPTAAPAKMVLQVALKSAPPSFTAPNSSHSHSTPHHQYHRSHQTPLNLPISSPLTTLTTLNTSDFSPPWVCTFNPSLPHYPLTRVSPPNRIQPHLTRILPPNHIIYSRWSHPKKYTVYSMQYTVYSMQYTVYSIQCTVCSTQCTAFSVQCTMYSI